MDFHGPEALANDALVQSLQKELTQIAKKYGINSAILMCSLQQRHSKDCDHVTSFRFHVMHGDVYANYGMASLHVKSFEAESIHNHVMAAMMRNQPPSAGAAPTEPSNPEENW